MENETGRRSNAIEELAKALHSEMDHLDPAPNDLPWNELPELDQEFFRPSVKALLSREELVGAAMN